MPEIPHLKFENTRKQEGGYSKSKPVTPGLPAIDKTEVSDTFQHRKVTFREAVHSSVSSGRVRGGKKHEIYAAAFGGHLFYDLFSQGRGGGAWLPRPPLDPLLVQVNPSELHRTWFAFQKSGPSIRLSDPNMQKQKAKGKKKGVVQLTVFSKEERRQQEKKANASHVPLSLLSGSKRVLAARSKVQ